MTNPWQEPYKRFLPGIFVCFNKNLPEILCIYREFPGASFIKKEVRIMKGEPEAVTPPAEM